jgi:PD-(D/E)XK nuclease superfamily
MSLYERLFYYRERENRAPREPFLTEAFGDILDRLNGSDPSWSAKFIVDVLLEKTRRTADPSANESFKQLCNRVESANRIEWSTQRSIEVGEGKSKRRPDISVDVDGGLTVVIEAKINAPLTDQLEDYGQGLLNEQAKSQRPPACALVFLTHTTQSPEDFLDRKELEKYHVPLRAVCAWADVHEFLKKKNTKNPFVDGLKKQFVDFLEEQGMDSIGPKDLSAINSLLKTRAQPKLIRFFEELRRTMKPSIEKLHYSFKRDRRIDPFDGTDGCFAWDFVYHQSSPGGLWYIAWGLIAGGENELKEVTASGDLYGFIEVGSDGEVLVPAGAKKSGWQYFDLTNNYLKRVNIRELERSVGGFINVFANWLRPSLAEADDILRSCLPVRPKRS